MENMRAIKQHGHVVLELKMKRENKGKQSKGTIEQRTFMLFELKTKNRKRKRRLIEDMQDGHVVLELKMKTESKKIKKPNKNRNRWMNRKETRECMEERHESSSVCKCATGRWCS